MGAQKKIEFYVVLYRSPLFIFFSTKMTVLDREMFGPSPIAHNTAVARSNTEEYFWAQNQCFYCDKEEERVYYRGIMEMTSRRAIHIVSHYILRYSRAPGRRYISPYR